MSAAPTSLSPLVAGEPTTKKLLFRSMCVLGSELCERLAYYSIVANLVLFFVNSLKLTPATANALQLAWSGTCYMTPLFGGWIADSFAGRWLTILAFMSVYIFGMVFLAVGAIGEVAASYSWVALLSLFIVALATGGIKANVAPFGADQFSDVESKKAVTMKESFFNWFYFSINFGSLLSFTAISYVQQEISFALGLTIAAVFMLLSLVLFAIGTRWYVRLNPAGSMIGRGLKIFYYAVVSHAKKDVNMGPSFFDRAKNARSTRNGEKLFQDADVDSIQKLSGLLPVFLTFVMFGTCYAQMHSLVFTQGLVLDLSVGGFPLPVSSLSVFNSLPIIVLIPLLDRLIYPALRNHTINFSMMRKIGTGFLLATLAMVYAGLLEMYRLYLVSQGEIFSQKVGDKTYTAAKLSILSQIPIYFLVGAGEVFANVAGLEFAYSQAPETMRSLIQAMFLVALGLGNYLGSVIVTIVNAATDPKWIGTDLNQSHLDYYFYILSILGFANFLVYLWVAIKYEHTQIPGAAAPSVPVGVGADGDAGGSGSRRGVGEKTNLLDSDGGNDGDDRQVVALDD